MTTLLAAAALLVGHDRCRFNCRAFLQFSLSTNAFSALHWLLFVRSECGAKDRVILHELGPAPFETTILRVSSVSRAKSSSSSCAQDGVVLALENKSLVFKRPSGALAALENVCLMLWLVFELARTPRLALEPALGLPNCVFALLQVRLFDDTERKFDAGFDDESGPGFDEPSAGMAGLVCRLRPTVVLPRMLIIYSFDCFVVRDRKVYKTTTNLWSFLFLVRIFSTHVSKS